jgi:beta-lactamase class A
VPGEVAAAIVDLETGERAGIHDDAVMHAASTMKVAVLLELFRQAAVGDRSLGDRMVVRNAFTSIVDSSRYALDPEDDGETALYARLGDEMTLVELARRMITRSSNLATNLLMQELGAERVRQTMAEIGAGELDVVRGVEDMPAYEAGLNNTTTARALAQVMATIAQCEAGAVHGALLPLLPADCRTMTDILADQHYTQRIPAGVPEDVRVANKTGTITRIAHDAAIVYPPGRAPYVLVVLTRGFEDTGVADRAIRGISADVWRALR